MLKKLRISVVVVATLSVLAALPVLPATLTAETGTRPARVVPTKATEPPAEGTSKPLPKVDRKTKRYNLKKLALEKLTLEKTIPENPPPEKPASEQPPPEQPVSDRDQGADPGPDKNPEPTVRAGVASAPVGPGPSRVARAKRPSAAAPPAAEQSTRDNRLLLSVPRLGLENVPMGDSPDQSYLDREGIMHLSGTGFPYERGSNTYIAGHAEGYNTSRVPHVFRNLHNLQRGDLITLRDATGKTYNYRVYERFVVTPYDVWVTKPVAGKQIVSLQTCFPAPTFEKRLIVRGELVQ